MLERTNRELDELLEVLKWFQDEVEEIDVSEAIEQLEILIEILNALEV